MSSVGYVSPSGDPRKVSRAGDTMSGPLVLAGDPAAALEPATKRYADGKVASVNGLLPDPDDGAVVLTPASIGALAQAKLDALRAGLATREFTPCRIAFAGSSTTAGANATKVENRYVNRLMSMIQAAYPSGVVAEAPVVTSASATWGTLSAAPGVHGYNAGVSGAVSADYLDATKIARLATLTPRMVVHMVGANDFSSQVPVATYKANVAARVADLKAALTAPCAHVLVHTYPKFGDWFTPVAPWAAYGQALREIAEADPDNIAFVDLSGSYAPVGVPGSDPLDLIDADQSHQTDAGHAFMAELLRQNLGIPLAPAAALVDPTLPALVSDTFTDPDGTLLTAHAGEVGATWTHHPTAASGGMSIDAGRVHQTTGNTTRMIASATPESADYTVSVDYRVFSTPAGTTIGIGGRYDASVQTGYYVRYIADTPGWRLDKAISGTVTTLGTVPLALAAGQAGRVRLSMKGSAIKVLIDGVVALAVTDTSLTAPGRIALLGTGVAMTASTGVHLDNIRAA